MLNIEDIFHFSQIPPDELKGQYNSCSFDSDCEGFRYHPLNDDVSLLRQASTAKSEMMRIYNMKAWQIEIRETPSHIEVVILFAGIPNNAKIIKKEMKRLGFAPSISSWIRRGLMI